MSTHEKTPTYNTIVSRRSIRRYTSDPVPQDVIKRLLAGAIWAPSAHNRQPWRFAVVETPEQKEQLALAMGKALRRDLEADGVAEDIISADVRRSHERMTSAPVLIVVCLSMLDMDVYPDQRRMDNEHIMAVQSTAMAGQNLLLAAYDAGLGACWMCAPLFCPEVVSTTLALPNDWQAQGLITLGYPAQQQEKSRKPLDFFVLWR